MRVGGAGLAAGCLLLAAGGQAVMPAGQAVAPVAHGRVGPPVGAGDGSPASGGADPSTPLKDRERAAPDTAPPIPGRGGGSAVAHAAASPPPASDHDGKAVGAMPDPPGGARGRERAAPDSAPPIPRRESGVGLAMAATGPRGARDPVRRDVPPARAAAAGPAVDTGGADGAPSAGAAVPEEGDTAERSAPPQQTAPRFRTAVAVPGQAQGPVIEARSALEAGLALLRANQPGDAHDAFMRALRTGRYPAAAFTGAGLAAEAQGMLTRARDYFEAARRIAPDSHVVQNNLGVVLYRLGEYGGAHRAFRAAFALSSGRNRAARRNLDMAAAAVAAHADLPDPSVTHRLSRTGPGRYRLSPIVTPERAILPAGASSALDSAALAGQESNATPALPEEPPAP